MLRQGHELGIDLVDLGCVVVDDDHRRRRVLLHPGQDLETPAPAVSAQRVGTVRDLLDLIEHEPGHDQCPVQEPGLDDLGDPSIDDRAAVDEDVRGPGSPAGFRIGSPNEPDGLGGHQQVLSLRHGQADHAEPEEERDPDRQVQTEGLGERREGRPEQQPHEQADQEADHRSDEFGRRHRLNTPDETRSRDDGQIRKDREAEHRPGNEPRHDDGARAGYVAEGVRLGRRGSDADQPAEGGAEDSNRADHGRSD